MVLLTTSTEDFQAKKLNGIKGGEDSKIEQERSCTVQHVAVLKFSALTEISTNLSLFVCSLLLQLHEC